jgi:uncharacterized membrane protein (DUF4010 family)
MIYTLFSKILLSILLGGAIGLERESSNQGGGSIGGIRTYSLISLFGSIAGIFVIKNYLFLSALCVGGFILLMLSSFIIESSSSKDFGFTSELSATIAFFLGIIIVMDIVPLQISITLFVILVAILSLKSKTSQLVSGISRQELQSFISYAIIALVVLPIIPNVDYELKDMGVLVDILKGLNIDISRFDNVDIINPRKVWFVVVLITGIDVLGYILGRMIGNTKGFALTSFFAGFVSSTSATQSLAQKSKITGLLFPFLGAALLSNMASFLQIFMLVGPLNPRWMIAIAPGVLLMILTAGLLSLYALKKKEQRQDASPEFIQKEKKIFALVPAMKFALLLILVKIITKVSLVVFGNSGFLISSIIASFAALDPILVNLAEMAGKTISYKFAFITLLTVNASNLTMKSLYSLLQGNKKFAMYFFFAALLIIGVSMIWLLLFPY